MKQEFEKKRVACLYRVSTKKQIDDSEGIPLQKLECQSFIKKNPEWYLIKEYEESGVSAFKKSASKRDVLQDAIADAEKGLYDILLVFKSDRLGRIADEYNLTVKAFGKNEVQVWSVTEGVLDINTLEESLIGYVRGFNNESESVKISHRVDASHRQMTAEGISRGGTLAYGFEYYKNGRFNGRDRHQRKELYDVRINEAEAAVVREIFEMYVSKGFGGVRIAKALNKRGIPTRENMTWFGQNINRMLRNPRYAGYDCYLKTSQKKDAKSYRQSKEKWILSPKQSHLQIVDDETWNKAQELLKERSLSIKSEGAQYPKKSGLLLSGLAKCGHCKHMLRMVSLKKTWTRKDGTTGSTKIQKYRCYYKTGGGGCDGQTEYSKIKIESIVMTEVYRYMDHLGKFDLSEDYHIKITQKTRSLTKQVVEMNEKLSAMCKEKGILETEIAKSLIGSSSFSPDQLASALSNKDSEISELKLSIAAAEQEIAKRKLQVEDLDKVKLLSQSFRNAFEGLDIDEKKVILKEIIDSIYVYRDKVEINMRINIARVSEYLLGDKKNKVDQSGTIIENCLTKDWNHD